MWEPVGPLPASVYWRRRWVAIASTATVLVMLVWSVAGAFARSGDESSSVRPASHAALSAPQQASSPPAAASPTPSQPGVTEPGPPPLQPVFELLAPPGVPIPPQVAPSTALAASPEVPPISEAPDATAEQLLPDESPRPSAPAPTPAQVPSTGPVPCTNPMLGVAAEVERPEHRVGERALLRLVVTNISDQPCVRDLDAARQEVVVWSADLVQRLWSSNDCSTAAGPALRTLVPGQPVVYSVRWAGRTSAPGCPVDRTVVPAGSYQVMTRVDDVVSAPTPFQRLPS
ncbi:hypothetical protein [Pseudonocardia aurantiaca]|uniref:MucR family transcriptional regulator n=1 Tax=Pseudonocardia aurantiaca TaxID=75290 RepID=A0ABW4FXI0_9PSEU